LPKYITPDYAARIAQIAISVVATLARAPTSPEMPSAMGSAAAEVNIGWSPPISGSAVDHYVVAARPPPENFYHPRVVVPAAQTSLSTTAAALGVDGAAAFYVSVSAVDRAGHEALFASREYRCDASHCVVPPDSLDVTARQ